MGTMLNQFLFAMDLINERQLGTDSAILLWLLITCFCFKARILLVLINIPIDCYSQVQY